MMRRLVKAGAGSMLILASLTVVLFLNSCADNSLSAPIVPTSKDIGGPRFDCSLFGQTVAGCQTENLPTDHQYSLLWGALMEASSSADFNCQMLASSISMMIDRTFFTADVWNMTDPATGNVVTAMGDHHYGAVGSQDQIHLATSYHNYQFSDRRIQNSFAHEAWHSFSTSDIQSQSMADECIPATGAGGLHQAY